MRVGNAPRELWKRVEVTGLMVTRVALGVQEKPMVECPL